MQLGRVLAQRFVYLKRRLHGFSSEVCAIPSHRLKPHVKFRRCDALSICQTVPPAVFCGAAAAVNVNRPFSTFFFFVPTERKLTSTNKSTPGGMGPCFEGAIESRTSGTMHGVGEKGTPQADTIL